MSNKYNVLFARATDEQEKALEQALDAHERRTGHRLSIAEVVRGGAARFCESEGVRFPSFRQRRSHKR